MPVLSNPSDKKFYNLLSGISATGTGSAIDTRHTLNAGYLQYMCSAESAIFSLESTFNPSASAWVKQRTVTATATETGYLNVVGFFPYIRANLTYVNAATAAASSATATVWAHWSPIVG